MKTHDLLRCCFVSVVIWMWKYFICLVCHKCNIYFSTMYARKTKHYHDNQFYLFLLRSVHDSEGYFYNHILTPIYYNLSLNNKMHACLLLFFSFLFCVFCLPSSSEKATPLGKNPKFFPNINKKFTNLRI